MCITQLVKTLHLFHFFFGYHLFHLKVNIIRLRAKNIYLLRLKDKNIININIWYKDSIVFIKR